MGGSCNALLLGNILFLETIAEQGLRRVVEKNKIFLDAFTLAEVLIVLGIIGLIADMTIPTLVSKTQDKVNTTKLKKGYSTLENSFRLAVQENGSPETWLSDSKSMIDGLAPYLKILKNCGMATGCFPNAIYKDINGNGNQNIDQNERVAKVQLADGSLLMALIWTPGCTTVAGSTKPLQNACGDMWIDVNGLSGPNQYGKDMFLFWMTKYGMIPFGTEGEARYSFDTHCKDIKSQVGQNGVGCAAWVIYNENMDYLHCDDLSWGGKKRCN